MNTSLNFNFLAIGFTFLFLGCKGNPAPPKEFYNSEFKWTISIPEDFEIVSEEDWKKIQNKGEDAIEKTFDTEIENQAKTIFIFKSDQLNYFESNYQPFDTLVDGNYKAACNDVNKMLYETFMAQIPGVIIDTVTSVEKIDNLEFQKLDMKITYPNKMVMTCLMFSRLFDKKEFSVNIMFIDKGKGKKMLDSWTDSKFGK